MSMTTTWPRPNRSALKPSTSPESTAGDWELVMDHSALGWVAVVASPVGVRLIWLGDSPESLQQSLKNRFPGVAFRDASRKAAAWARRIIAYCDGKSTECNAPLDIHGTAFQKEVWQTLAAIPRGSTLSYSEVAQKIGRPKAVRAVGTACGSNPLAPIIPCHRVLRGDGSLGGYGYGLNRKRLLLDREGIIVPESGKET